MKHVHRYQEIAHLIEQGNQVVFTCYPEARVSSVQKHPDSDIVTVTITLSIRDSWVGMVEYEYASMLVVLDAFDRDEHGERWEVVGTRTREGLAGEAVSWGEL